MASEQARVAALLVVLIGVSIALMLVLRPRGLLGEALKGVSIPQPKPATPIPAARTTAVSST